MELLFLLIELSYYTHHHQDEDEVYDDTATVRVQHHNQHDRRMLNKWWKGQVSSNNLAVLFDCFCNPHVLTKATIFSLQLR